MKIANIDRQIFHMFWTTSEKMYFKIILKVTKNQGFTLSLEDTFFEKPLGGREGGGGGESIKNHI